MNTSLCFDDQLVLSCLCVLDRDQMDELMDDLDDTDRGWIDVLIDMAVIEDIDAETEDLDCFPEAEWVIAGFQLQ